MAATTEVIGSHAGKSFSRLGPGSTAPFQLTKAGNGQWIFTHSALPAGATIALVDAVTAADCGHGTRTSTSKDQSGAVPIADGLKRIVVTGNVGNGINASVQEL
jgi:hypothetical protein